MLRVQITAINDSDKIILRPSDIGKASVVEEFRPLDSKFPTDADVGLTPIPDDSSYRKSHRYVQNLLTLMPIPDDSGYRKFCLTPILSSSHLTHVTKSSMVLLPYATLSILLQGDIFFNKCRVSFLEK
jgi:hypothetical protein